MQPHHRPLASHKRLSLASFLILLTSFLLLLLVGLSLTIIPAVYILRVYSTTNVQPQTSIATELRFGVWGVCASSVLDPPTLLRNPGFCYGPQLGYEIPEILVEYVGISDSVVQTVRTSLLTVLVLHLIASGFSFLALLASLFLAWRTMVIISLITAIISALLTTVVFIIDLVLVLGAKSQLPGLTNGGFGADIGNAVWMVLAAIVLTWIAVVLLSARACHCCGIRRRTRHGEEKHSVDE